MSENDGIRFATTEINADASLTPVELQFEGNSETGWLIRRIGTEHLALGAGYRLLETQYCGLCSTDLDRPFLPFPLPQVVGHEVVARDEMGQRCVIEINASHRARGIEANCPFCDAGLDRHCPERLVLGIHDLPGGFAPQILAPIDSVLPISDEIEDEVAVLLEPFAAALHAVDSIRFQNGDRVAVLGPRRLGLLIIAALAARKRVGGLDIEIHAWSRHEDLCRRAYELGADAASSPPNRDDTPRAEVVFDTTGHPEGFEQALGLAEREVHLKSTHGRPAGGLVQSTALVVDELRLQKWTGDLADPGTKTANQKPTRIAWLSSAPSPPTSKHVEIIRGEEAADMLRILETNPQSGLPRMDAAVVDSLQGVDEVIRPIEGRESALVRPQGTIFLHPTPHSDHLTSGLAQAILLRNLSLSASRCGDFRPALALLQTDAQLRTDIAQLITHRMTAENLTAAFEQARRHDTIKVIVEHPTKIP